ncbi:hypothetical protein MMC09_006852 [Bachmanniomyces sp. S44760]|nr:hypothetical protein [Bachmanniomyces sp. S44760]
MASNHLAQGVVGTNESSRGLAGEFAGQVTPLASSSQTFPCKVEGSASSTTQRQDSTKQNGRCGQRAANMRMTVAQGCGNRKPRTRASEHNTIVESEETCLMDRYGWIKQQIDQSLKRRKNLIKLPGEVGLLRKTDFRATYLAEVALAEEYERLLRKTKAKLTVAINQKVQVTVDKDLDILADAQVAKLTAEGKAIRAKLVRKRQQSHVETDSESSEGGCDGASDSETSEEGYIHDEGIHREIMVHEEGDADEDENATVSGMHAHESCN